MLWQVVLGRWRGAYVAVKVLHGALEQGGYQDALGQFRLEAEMLQGLRHPNILSFYGACFDSKPARLLPRLCEAVAVASGFQRRLTPFRMRRR